MVAAAVVAVVRLRHVGPSSIPGFTGGNAERIASMTVNVNGGLSTSADIGEAVVNALRAYNRSAGPLQLEIA